MKKNKSSKGINYTDVKNDSAPIPEDILDIETVASSNECTGLIPTPPQSGAEADSYTKIYDIPQPNTNSKFKNI